MRSLHASAFSLGASDPPEPQVAPRSAADSRALSRAGETIKVPSMAESITEGTLKQWLKKKGDYVEADEEVATIETDKVRLLAGTRTRPWDPAPTQS